MKLALLVTSRQGPRYEWVEHWVTTLDRLKIAHRMLVVSGGSDLVLARCLTAGRAYREAEDADAVLWLDDDILAPRDPSRIVDLVDAAFWTRNPVSGSFLRRNHPGSVVGHPRAGEPTTFVNRGREILLVPELCGLGCLAIPNRIFRYYYERAPRLPGGEALVCLPKFEGGTYFSEDYAYCDAFPITFRSPSIAFGHYAKSTAAWPPEDPPA